jgi:ketosteroid isomerase-like protein
MAVSRLAAGPPSRNGDAEVADWRDNRPIEAPRDILDRGYAAFNRGDHETLFEMMEPDFVWHEALEVPGRKAAVGRDEFAGYMRGFERMWEDFRFDILDVEEVDDEMALARVRACGRGRASGEQMELEIYHLWRFRNGRVARMDAYLDEGAARDALPRHRDTESAS